MQPAKIAVLGAGLIGARHVRLAAAEPSVELAAVVDPDPAAARLAAEAGAPHFPDLDAMLAKLRPEGAIVATPTGLHREIGEACAAAGLHMLMEKPIAPAFADGKALVDAAAAAGVQLMVGHHRRFDPAVEKAREIVQGGGIGRLVAVSAIWFVRKPDPYFAPPWRRAPGAGPILTNLIHDIDLLRHVCGEIESVYAETSDRARGFAVEDTAAILLRFRSGALATIALSDAAPSPWGWEQGTNDNPNITATGEDCYFFAGAEASLAFPSLDIWSHADRKTHGWGDPLDKAATPLRPRQALADQLRHFAHVIRGAEPPRVSGQDGLATLAATEATFAAAAKGRPVRPEAVA